MRNEAKIYVHKQFDTIALNLMDSQFIFRSERVMKACISRMALNITLHLSYMSHEIVYSLEYGQSGMGFRKHDGINQSSRGQRG